MDASFRKTIHGETGQQSLQQNILVVLRFSYHHFYRRREQIWGNSSFILSPELWIWFVCCVNKWHWCVKIIPHLYWALNFEYDSFVMLTDDVLITLLPCCAIFLRIKLKNLCTEIGTGTSTWYHPVHELANVLGEREAVLKPIENSHSHWVRLAK